MYSKTKAKMKKTEEQTFKTKPKLKAEQNPNDEKVINELYAVNLRLERLLKHKTRGAILRSKSRRYEQGERNTRYFFNLEKQNYCKKTVTKLKRNDNTYTNNITRGKSLLRNTLHLKKHRNENFSNSSFFNLENITPLSEDEKLSCEGAVGENECFIALKEFKNDKTPGTDGLSAEFCKFFWPEVCTEMIGSFNYAFQSGALSISQKRGIISLIPKKDKDKTILENIRPISLLNVDYKILTKTIAKRLEKLLPRIINPDQTGCVKGCFIVENYQTDQRHHVSHKGH